MAAPVIQFKRGLLANLPGLRAGEPGFTTDAYDLYVGIDSTTNNNQFVGSGRYWSVNTNSVGSGVKLVEGTDNGTNAVTIKSPNSLAASYTLTMPADDGNANEILTTDGSGNLSFAAPASSSFTLAADSGSNDTFSTGGTLTFAGTANEVETTVSNDQIQIGLPDNVTVGGNLTVTTTLDVNGSDHDIAGAVALDHVTVSGITTVTGAIDGNGGANISGAETVLSSATVSDLTDNRVVIAGSSGALEDDANLTFNGSTLALGAALDVNGDGHDIAGTIALDHVNTSGITTTTSVRGYSALFSTKAAATTTFVVTVASKTSDHRYNGSGSSSGYFIDGQESPIITLVPGKTYRFDQADSTNSGHPLLFYLESDKTTQYTTNITTNGTPGSAGAYTQVIVGDETPPVLHYQCSSHGLMGNAAVFQSNVINSNYNAVLRGNLTLGSSTAVNAILDEDNMSSNSATSLATQQSIKAYVDAQLGATDLTIGTAGDSGTGTVSTSQSLTIAGTANEIETVASNQTVTVGLPDDVTIGNNLTVTGNLFVNGSTTQVNTSQTTIEDQLLELGMVDGSAPSSDLNKDIGILLNYYSGSAKKAAVYWDDSTSRVVVSSDVSESSGVLTSAAGASLEVGKLFVAGCSGTTDEVIGCSNNTIVITNATIDGGSF